MNRALAALLAVILLCGLLLRFAGLSHDLSEGYVYHPDTPKQIRAAQRFLGGVYNYRVNHPDYDGYPYFNSHLVEYICRAYRFGANTVLTLVGAPRLGRPEPLALYWITRVLNSLLSTLSIAVVFALGLRAAGAAAAVVAAIFLAFSPVDVAASHYATSDATAAFFALLSVLYALRIYDRGGALDSVLAGFFASCGFAAKYNAGIAILPAALAHLLRASRPSGLSWLRLFAGLGLLAASALASLFLTIPTLWSDPVETIHDILGFLHHTSNVNVPVPAQGGFPERFLFSLFRNTPVLADVVGPHLLMVALIGLVLPTGDWRRRVIIASLPVVYFLVVVPMRPKAPAVYHTLTTPLVFLIAAAALTSSPFAASTRVSRLWRIVSVCLIAGSAWYLLRYSLREDFFFARQDTRRMARQWTEENVPSSFKIETNGYTFSIDPPSSPIAKAPGRLILSTNLRPLKHPATAFLLKRFHLEESALPVFRNPTIEMFVDTPVLAKGFRVPVFHPLPARSGNDFIFEGGPGFYRREKEFLLAPGEKIDRTLVTEEPLEDALFVIRAAGLPTTVNLSLGNVRREVRLGPAESRWVSVEGMKRSFASQDGIDLYRLLISAGGGTARVTLATTSLEKGLALYARGFYAEAHSWLARAASMEEDPEIAALAVISREHAGVAANEPEHRSLDETAQRVAELVDRRALDARYGGITEYLDSLEYASYEAESLPTEGFRAIPDEQASNGRAIGPTGAPAGANRLLSIPFEMLEQGYYTLKARLKAPGARQGRVSLRLTDASGAERYQRDFDCCSPDASGFTIQRFDFEIPSFEPEWRLSVGFDRAVIVDTVEIVPDLVGEARAIARLLEPVVGRH